MVEYVDKGAASASKARELRVGLSDESEDLAILASRPKVAKKTARGQVERSRSRSRSGPQSRQTRTKGVEKHSDTASKENAGDDERECTLEGWCT